MNLAHLQRDLAALIRGETIDAGDGYVASAAASTGLEVTREIIASWRELLLRRACPLTFALLVQRGRLDVALRELAARHLSSYVEAAACTFLAAFAGDADPLVAAVARFESAVIETRHGSDAEFTIDWPCPPDEAIERLIAGQPVDDLLPAGRYTMTISSECGA